MAKVKVWRDSDEVIKMVHELPSDKLRHLDKEMTEKPKKWDKKDNYNHNQNR